MPLFDESAMPAIDFERVDQTENKINKLLFKSAVDYDTISHDIVARSRKPGDRFAPAGRKLSKPMKQIFSELSIPADRRSEMLLLEMGGTVFFVEAAGAAEGFQVCAKTKRVLLVALHDPGEAGEL